MTAATLAIPQSARAIVRAYQAACHVVARSFGDLVEAERTLNIALTASQEVGSYDTRSVSIPGSDCHHGHAFEAPDKAITRLRRATWGALLVRLEVQCFTSPQRWREIEKQVEDDDLPEITDESVAEFVQGLIDQRADLLTEAVASTFNFLRAHRDDYKTNNLVEVGEKVVLTWMVESSFGSRSGRRIRYGVDVDLLAMERVFAMLDGKGEISKSHYSELRTAIEENVVGETTWCRYRAFKNGNLHLTFRRRDLVKRLNAIAGGKRLRPERRTPVQHGEELAVSS